MALQKSRSHLKEEEERLKMKAVKTDVTVLTKQTKRENQTTKETFGFHVVIYELAAKRVFFYSPGAGVRTSQSINKNHISRGGSEVDPLENRFEIAVSNTSTQIRYAFLYLEFDGGRCGKRGLQIGQNMKLIHVQYRVSFGRLSKF